MVHTLDLVVSALGILSVGGTPSTGPKQPVEDPYSVMKQVRGGRNPRASGHDSGLQGAGATIQGAVRARGARSFNGESLSIQHAQRKPN